MASSEEVRAEIERQNARSIPLDPRIERIENQVSNLASSVAKVSANIDSLTNSMHGINNRVGGIEQRQQESQKTNYAPFGIAATVILFALSAGGALVASSITSESSAREYADRAAEKLANANDAAQREYFDLAISLRAEIINANRRATEAQIAGEIKRIDQNREEDTEAQQQLRERVSTLYSMLDNKIDERFALFDVTLQREMRLLDEVLQRELGLNIDRIDEILALIEQRLGVIEGSRFDNSRGDRLEADVKELRDYNRDTP